MSLKDYKEEIKVRLLSKNEHSLDFFINKLVELTEKYDIIIEGIDE